MTMTTKLWGYGMAVMAALFLALVLGDSLAQMLAPASENSRIRAGNCRIYATNNVDPIAFSAHLHQHFGNRFTTNDSTGEQLKAAGRSASTCKVEDNWFTSDGWFPKPRTFGSDKVTAYYRDPGDIRVQPIPTGLELLTGTTTYKGSLTTMRFQNCVEVDGFGRPVLESADQSHLYDARARACPSSHPYRIPQISFLIHWNGGSLTASTPVSVGNGQYAPAGQHFHADYLAAVQDEFNFATSEGAALIDLCLNDVPVGITMASPRCGVGP